MTDQHDGMTPRYEGARLKRERELRDEGNWPGVGAESRHPYPGYTPGGVGPLPAPERQVLQPARPQTLGEYRVGVDFNPGRSPAVNGVKRMAADMIDFLDQFRSMNSLDGEQMRLVAEAMTGFEDAAMWAVKAITKPRR